MFTHAFWKAAAERSVKTGSQTLAALLVAAGTGLLDTDWLGALSAAGMAALLSVLTSVGSAAATDSGSPSAIDAEVLPPEGH